MNNKPDGYSDIINMKYPFSLKRPRMSEEKRAAQFSSFKALSGFEEEINERGKFIKEQSESKEDTEFLID